MSKHGDQTFIVPCLSDNLSKSLYISLLHSADLKFDIQKLFQLMKKQDRRTQNGLE